MARAEHLARRRGALHGLPPRRRRRRRSPSSARRRARRGTEVTFLPSTETFKIIEFDYGTLEHRLRELAFLNSGVRIVLDRPAPRRAEARGAVLRGRHRGLRAISRPRQEARDPAPDPGPRPSATASASRSRCGGTTPIYENVLCFTNNIPQRDGGTHLAGFRAALTRQVTGYAENSGLLKREKVTLTGEDCARG